MSVPSVNVVDKKACTGCGACEVACPIGCVTMEEDKEGFLAPTIETSRCVSCGKCLRVCPASGESWLFSPRCSFVLRSLDLATRNSSSGGAAYAIGKLMIDRGGAVVACCFDGKGVARHVVAEDEEALRATQGSKYVQSDARDGYRALGKILADGREVLFVGTPCQVAAARALYSKRKGLTTCDLICHGVPSPGFWRKALEWNNEHGRLIDRASVMFRSSDRRSRANYELFCKTCSDGRTPYEHDAYYASFIRNASLRESCYRCPFAREERAGDLTVGDCASRDRYPDFHPCKSVSSVHANTDKGEELLAALTDLGVADAEEIDFEVEARLNKQLRAPSVRPGERDAIYGDLESMGYETFTRRYRAKVSPAWYAKRAAKSIVSVGTRAAIKKFIGGVLHRGR